MYRQCLYPSWRLRISLISPFVLPVFLYLVTVVFIFFICPGSFIESSTFLLSVFLKVCKFLGKYPSVVDPPSAKAVVRGLTAYTNYHSICTAALPINRKFRIPATQKCDRIHVSFIGEWNQLLLLILSSTLDNRQPYFGRIINEIML